ncbi:hypothetical protein PR048_029932 [Dryococelus australis]|uniref:Uncharacterized protein n=1 Tax=Dryococelus australis TaxID=614101 RepID=A0ABQ9G7J3_9NEOP|nr:hypothetical protein PR048_029932 [Dryococelus australis]
MERGWNEGAGETGDPRENPPTNGIVRHDPTCEHPVIEPGSPWWEASVLIAQPPWPRNELMNSKRGGGAMRYSSRNTAFMVTHAIMQSFQRCLVVRSAYLLLVVKVANSIPTHCTGGNFHPVIPYLTPERIPQPFLTNRFLISCPSGSAEPNANRNTATPRLRQSEQFFLHQQAWSNAGKQGRGGNRRSPRKPADQGHHPARFPRAKIREQYCQGSDPVCMSGKQSFYFFFFYTSWIRPLPVPASYFVPSSSWSTNIPLASRIIECYLLCKISLIHSCDMILSFFKLRAVFCVCQGGRGEDYTTAEGGSGGGAGTELYGDPSGGGGGVGEPDAASRALLRQLAQQTGLDVGNQTAPRSAEALSHEGSEHNSVSAAPPIHLCPVALTSFTIRDRMILVPYRDPHLGSQEKVRVNRENRAWFTLVIDERSSHFGLYLPKSLVEIYRNRIRLEIASQKQSSGTHKTPYDRVERCREREINIEATERVSVEVLTRNKRPSPQHNHTPFLCLGDCECFLRLPQGTEIRSLALAWQLLYFLAVHRVPATIESCSRLRPILWFGVLITLLVHAHPGLTSPLLIGPLAGLGSDIGKHEERLSSEICRYLSEVDQALKYQSRLAVN